MNVVDKNPKPTKFFAMPTVFRSIRPIIVGIMTTTVLTFTERHWYRKNGLEVESRVIPETQLVNECCGNY